MDRALFGPSLAELRQAARKAAAELYILEGNTALRRLQQSQPLWIRILTTNIRQLTP